MRPQQPEAMAIAEQWSTKVQPKGAEAVCAHESAWSVKCALVEAFALGSFSPPLFPKAAQKALKLIKETDPNIGEIVSLLEQDPALAAHLLRLANSPYYRAANETVDIQSAMMRLGFRGLQEMLMIASTSRLLAIKNNPRLTERLQARAPAVAHCAAEIASALNSDWDTAFLAGLLHDIGWSVVYGLAATGGERFHSTLNGDPGLLQRVAEEIHPEMGMLLAEKWDLPQAICTVIGYHNSPADAGLEANLVHIVAGAIRLCDYLKIFPEFDRETLEHDSVLLHLGLPAQTINEICINFQLGWAA